MTPQQTLDLADWRRRVAAMYATVRELDPEAGWRHWREVRDELFTTHPCTPRPPDEAAGRGPVPAWPYDPSWRMEVELRPTEATDPVGLAHSADGVTMARPVGEVSVARDGQEGTLVVFWLDQYGGGLFLPFRDATSGDSTYGGGRYLDVRPGEDGVVPLDFNRAYHPTCVVNPTYSCPIPPPQNTLPLLLEAGERYPESEPASGA